MKKYICNIPDVLIFLRILFLPIIVYGIISDNYLFSSIFFSLFIISDMLGDYIAQKFKIETKLGIYFQFGVRIAAMYVILISLIIKKEIGILNISLSLVATIALIFIITQLFRIAKVSQNFSRMSNTVFLIIISVSFYLFFFKVYFADIFLFLSFTVIFFYIIPDYIALILKMRAMHK